MKRSFFYIAVLFVFSSLFVVSCVEEGDDPPKKSQDTTKTSDDKVEKFKQTSAQILMGFTSTVEVAAVIKDMDVPYSQRYMVDADVVGDFVAETKKAFALGMLSVDLGYLNIYDRIASNLKYMSEIHDLSDELNIAEFFDFQTLKRLASNSENQDSLIFLTVRSYHSMNKGLIRADRMYLSAAMVSGAWLEGMYLSSVVSKEAEKDELRERIADQKEMIDNLVIILEFFDKKPFMVEVAKDFKRLQAEYAKIKMKTVTDDGSVDESDTLLVSTGPVEYEVPDITDEQYNTIRTMVEEIRAKHTQPDTE